MRDDIRRMVRWFLGGGTILAVALTIALGLRHDQPAPREPTTTSARKSWQPPPVSPTEFLNAAVNVKYVGTAACAKCHPGEHETYLQTAHSSSLSLVKPDGEPPDATFRHALSGRRYEVRRSDSKMVHRELLDAGGENSPIVSEYAVKYLVGSGRHTRTYLIEDDGFLAESPITWYASRQSWGMSPGYDRPQHQGFERAADAGCLFCHAGTFEMVDQSFSRLKFHELAIGCERCHGPGELHVAKQSETPTASGEKDTTIVHPGRLPRELGESICAECHLRGNATVTLPGRRRSDFRPGLRLSDFRVDYHLESGRSKMKVVGHVEQMRLSRCYRSSPTLTCTTCHDPHGTPAAEEKVAFYRAKCLSCHQESCRMEESERLKRSAEDYCVSCHMPQSETDIPHIAFTHHRIGLHGQAEEPDEIEVAGALAAFDLPPRLSTPDRNRCLGLAYLELADHTALESNRRLYRSRGAELLTLAAKAGIKDGDLLTALARLHWEDESPQAVELASRALEENDISPAALLNALYMVGESSFHRGKHEVAQPALARLVQLRRHPNDWMLLGANQFRTGSTDAGLASLNKAVEISPFRADLRMILADFYVRAGDPAAAEAQKSLAERISRAVQGSRSEPRRAPSP